MNAIGRSYRVIVYSGFRKPTKLIYSKVIVQEVNIKKKELGKQGWC